MLCDLIGCSSQLLSTPLRIFYCNSQTDFFIYCCCVRTSIHFDVLVFFLLPNINKRSFIISLAVGPVTAAGCAQITTSSGVSSDL